MTADSAGSAATTTITYGAAGDITKVMDPDGSYQSFTWDNARRLTTVTNNLGETINYTRDNMGGATAITRVNWNASATTFTRTQTFDELGRLLTESVPQARPGPTVTTRRAMSRASRIPARMSTPTRSTP
jgi:YD repeat-containing protein